MVERYCQRTILIILFLLLSVVFHPRMVNGAPPVFSCTISASATLAFGTLDPAVATNTAAIPTSIQFTCTRSAGGGKIAYTITETRSGSYTVAPVGYKMQHQGVPTTEYIPYAITYTLAGAPIVFPFSGNASNNVPETITITGTVLGVDYQNAYVGAFGDTIGLTITP